MDGQRRGDVAELSRRERAQQRALAAPVPADEAVPAASLQGEGGALEEVGAAARVGQREGLRLDRAEVRAPLSPQPHRRHASLLEQRLLPRPLLCNLVVRLARGSPLLLALRLALLPLVHRLVDADQAAA